MSDFDENIIKKQKLSIDTIVVSHNPNKNDPYGATSMPIYQSATFQQPSATSFGDYDYTRSGNPTRDALQNQIAILEGTNNSKSFCFTTGMAALTTIAKLACNGDEIIVNDDSYGGTYRLMSSVCTRQGISIKYINLAGIEGSKKLKEAITSSTRLGFSLLI